MGERSRFCTWNGRGFGDVEGQSSNLQLDFCAAMP
jgi:hypothetical protein